MHRILAILSLLTLALGVASAVTVTGKLSGRTASPSWGRMCMWSCLVKINPWSC